ncbi:unnamed protein product, partial [Chrysoparadoxa australica]
AEFGVCAACASGQVATTDRTGCEYCPDGQIKSGVTCVGPADLSFSCSPITYASFGVCNSCPGNQVANTDYTGCEDCPAGTIQAAQGCIGPGEAGFDCLGNEAAMDGQC